jgi:hypothetical protein
VILSINFKTGTLDPSNPGTLLYGVPFEDETR